MHMLITSFEAEALLSMRKKGLKELDISLDLGITSSKVYAEEDFFLFPKSQRVPEGDIKKILKKESVCFFIEGNMAKKAAIFSDETNNYYKLVPTGPGKWPTIEISGIRMHVTKRYSPKEDTEEKISYVGPCTGNVLDTCTGLGYTAILASKTASLVFTVERDANVIELQKINPYSRELFSSSRIKRLHGDSFEEIKKFKACYFDRIIHDPPRLALSTLLYSQEFYNEMFRTLKPGGKMFHYTGDPGSKRGLDIREGITKRLAASGFRTITRVFNGLKAEKS